MNRSQLSRQENCGKRYWPSQVSAWPAGSFYNTIYRIRRYKCPGRLKKGRLLKTA